MKNRRALGYRRMQCHQRASLQAMSQCERLGLVHLGQSSIQHLNPWQVSSRSMVLLHRTSAKV
jgi:hypothetical protein